MKLIYLSIIVFSLPLFLQAQGTTCNDPLWINTTESQHLDFVPNTTTSPPNSTSSTDEVEPSPTRPPFTPNLWLHFQPTTPGILAFTLAPDIPTDDLDFTLYQLNEVENCIGMTPVRIMSAGPRIGDAVHLSEACIGSTGLQADETDTESPAGCPEGTNNYLATINVQAGDAFALHITNHTSLQGFTLGFTTDVVLADEAFTLSNIPIKAYPNPSVGDFQLEFLMPITGRATIYAYSTQGQRVYEEALDLAAGQQSVAIPAINWPSGLYWLGVMVDGERRGVKVEKI